MAPPNNEITLKVLIHKEENRVVFAEANADFVDILFSFLTMPMGTVVRLLSNHSKQPSIGSFSNLYRSIVNLEAKYFAKQACKDMLLNTRNSAEDDCRKLKINIEDIKPIEYFTCCCYMDCTERNNPAYFSIYNGLLCQNCQGMLSKRANYCWETPSRGHNGVFVSPNASYVVTDDLRVIPNILASSFAILKKSGITDLGLLEKKTVVIGSTEILDLLMYSILSKTPLSDMFLETNYNIIDKSFQTVNCEMSAQLFESCRKMKVKVLVLKSNNKILLAHSSEEFINFLLYFLTVPLGRVSQLSKDDAPVLGVENIYQSVSDMNVGKYFNSQVKDILVCPQLAILYQCSNRNFTLKEERIPKFYRSPFSCESHCVIRMDSSPKDRELLLVSPFDETGFLNGSTNFMVTDDLVVTPLSSMFCVEYLQSLKVSPSDIEEQVIDVGLEEAKNLLKASLVSTSVLTNGLKHLIQTKQDTERIEERSQHPITGEAKKIFPDYLRHYFGSKARD